MSARLFAAVALLGAVLVALGLPAWALVALAIALAWWTVRPGPPRVRLRVRADGRVVHEPEEA